MRHSKTITIWKKSAFFTLNYKENKTPYFPEILVEYRENKCQCNLCLLRSIAVVISTEIKAFMKYGNNRFLKTKKKLCVL